MSFAAREKARGMITAIPNPIKPQPITNGRKELDVTKIMDPIIATNPEYRAVFEGPMTDTILSPINLMVNIQIEKTVKPSAALPSLMLKTLIRKIALQSAIAPSPNEAKNVIKATVSKGPLGIEINGTFLSLCLFSD